MFWSVNWLNLIILRLIPKKKPTFYFKVMDADFIFSKASLIGL